MKQSLLLVSFLLLVSIRPLFAQYDIVLLDSNRYVKGEGVVLSKTSFRGLSVVDNKTFWISGSRGTVGKSVNGGKTVYFRQIPGYEKSDFRDIEAFDAQRAIIMSSGTPAYILKTNDGGLTWKEVFKDSRPEVFLDAMDFWDRDCGIIVGDPVNKHFFLLKTNNGGDTWTILDSSITPMALDSEAIFAASGTSLRCWGDNEFGFVTGGSVSRFMKASLAPDSLRDLRVYGVPLQIGKPSTGAFSFCTTNGNVLAVGGDYAQDALVASNSAALVKMKDVSPCEQFDGFIARNTEDDVKGYRSSVELLKNGTMFVACGTSGVDVGETKFTNKTSEGFHVVRKAKKGRAVYLAGGKGKIARLVY